MEREPKLNLALKKRLNVYLILAFCGALHDRAKSHLVNKTIRFKKNIFSHWLFKC